MSKRNPPQEVTRRAALINGTAITEPSRTEFICISERHGKRQLRLSAISQVIQDAGQIGGPWFVRCDGQQLPVSETNARVISDLLGLTMENAKP